MFFEEKTVVSSESRVKVAGRGCSRVILFDGSVPWWSSSASLALLLALTLYLAHRERQERLDAARWAAQTLEPPVFDWRPTRRWATFLSHYKMECATDARYLSDLLRKILRAPIYLDSSTLADLRNLFTDGIHKSDTVVLMATKGVLTRPWCLLEMWEAAVKRVPIVLFPGVGVASTTSGAIAASGSDGIRSP